MIRKIIPIVAVMAIANGMVAQNAQQVELAREKIQKWVETRQVISKESSEWKVQKESLLSTKELLQQELEGLEVKLSELSDNESAADQERAELTQTKQDLSAATDSVKAKIADMEVQVKELVKSFPEPLLALIDPILRRIPEDPYKPGKTSVANRIPNVVAVIQQAAKFNSTLHFHNETVEVGGREIQVDVIYWGMALAYFVDKEGAYAGYKYPSKGGWKTEVINESAPLIRGLVDIYQGKTTAIEFVDVPAAIN